MHRDVLQISTSVLVPQQTGTDPRQKSVSRSSLAGDIALLSRISSQTYTRSKEFGTWGHLPADVILYILGLSNILANVNAAAAITMSLEELDAETLLLVMRMQLEDLEDLASLRKGKHREGETRDIDLVIDSYKEELEAYAALASDQAMCRSIARAVDLDADVIHASVLEDEQAAQDRQLALNPEGSTEEVVARPETIRKVFDEELLSKLQALYVSAPKEDLDGQPESSSWAASRPGSNPGGGDQRMRVCMGCGDEHYFFNVARCPCSHEYCRECFEGLFRAAMTDESYFPPRCCGQAVPLDANRIFLPFTLVGEFLAKKVEFETPNRTYCHEPTCSTFIPTQFIHGDVAKCFLCHHTTCVMCNGPSHEDECPDDAAAQELLRVAAENGWQRCYSCRRLVELEVGCNHMSASFCPLNGDRIMLTCACIACRCGAQFCYICGATWKTCLCDQWNEERLLTRANAIVDRDVGARQLDDGRRATQLERERQNLIENHQCRHLDWRSRGGSHQCEECYDVLPRYIFECLQCRLMACRRCRYNRL